MDERRRRRDWKGERVTIALRGEPEMHEEIAHLASERDMTINDYLRALLRHALYGEPKP